MLVAAGFGEPVIDMEMITLTYAAPGMLLAELRAAGQVNVRGDRRRTLTGRMRWQHMIAAYAALAREGRVPATFEVVYGHAWKAAPRTSADGRAVVRFDKWAGQPKRP
jgi:malonyl-CoA O-methyltransferase